MVFADAEYVEPHLVGQFDLFQKIAHPLRAERGESACRVARNLHEAVQADFHEAWLSLAVHRSTGPPVHRHTLPMPAMETPRMTEPIRWGILGAANIAVTKVIPAMQSHCPFARRRHRVARPRQGALGSGVARHSARVRVIRRADRRPEIDAIYNPLPNHLHVPWSIRAADAGKHVLCEKPIALSADEARALRAARDRNGVVIAEAFMVRGHPQWLEVESDSWTRARSASCVWSADTSATIAATRTTFGAGRSTAAAR